MTEPTRQEIIDAYEALETLCARVGEDTPVNAMRSLILTALPPKPLPTMAEVEWDDDKHYLAEAEHTYWGKVIMLYRHAGLRQIQYLRAGGANEIRLADPADLTPTGRRYTLTEVQE